MRLQVAAGVWWSLPSSMETALHVLGNGWPVMTVVALDRGSARASVATVLSVGRGPLRNGGTFGIICTTTSTGRRISVNGLMDDRFSRTLIAEAAAAPKNVILSERTLNNVVFQSKSRSTSSLDLSDRRAFVVEASVANDLVTTIVDGVLAPVTSTVQVARASCRGDV
jgi:hypothetical protein